MLNIYKGYLCGMVSDNLFSLMYATYCEVADFSIILDIKIKFGTGLKFFSISSRPLFFRKECRMACFISSGIVAVLKLRLTRTVMLGSR